MSLLLFMNKVVGRTRNTIAVVVFVEKCEGAESVWRF